jgi:hypothetical protein
MVTAGLLMAHLYTDMRPSGRLDPDEIKKAKVDRAALRRAWGFARAYRGHLIAYLATIVLAASSAPSRPWSSRR